LPLSGATNYSYSAGSYGDYWVEVSNTYGCFNTSNHIFIYEKPLPTAVVYGDGLVCATAGGTAQFSLWAYYNANYSYTWTSNPPGATFTPNGSNLASSTWVTINLPMTLPYTAAFIVKVTDTVTGCENYDTLCVTFYETPPISVNFQSGCEGTPYTLVPTPNNPALYDYHWSNGATTPIITVSHAGAYGLTITDKQSGCSASTIGAIIYPKPDLSLFPRGCDSICHTDTLHLYIPLPLNALPPYNTYASTYPVIQWYANGNYGTPIGSGQNLYFSPGVPGVYQISVVVGTVYGCLDTAGVYCLTVYHCDSIIGVDWGDAPDVFSNPFDYPTLMASNGARHNIVPGVFLGTKVDAEPDGQPSVGADCDDNDCLYASSGDDEDGVNMPAVVEIGNTYNITVQASVAGYLDAWIDYNLDGTWTLAGEHIFINQPLAAGANSLSFTVPATASMGQSYARFRFRSTNTAINFYGLVANGEVEDYPVFIDECSSGEDMDFGDAPDMPAVGYNYPTLLSSNGARHIRYLNIRLGALIDGEADGQPNTTALGDDMAGSDDEDGVVFPNKMYVGFPATVQVTASVNGFLNAWMDFNKDGDWADPGEQIFTNQPLVAGVNTLTFNIPATAAQGKTYSRFRFNTVGGLTYFGLALNGEVEDYQVHACPHWWPVHTNVKHYITIPHDLPNLVDGDVLGVFYQTATGELACGGLTEFTSEYDQMMIAYGDNPATPVKDGFAVGEPIIWKLCSVIKGDANPVDVVYDFTYPQYSGLFVQNGISALTAVNGLHVTATATPSAICAGSAVQLHAAALPSEGISYTWTSSSGDFTSDQQNPVAYPEQNTTYSVDAFDGVFHATASVSVVVTQVNPLVEILPLQNKTIPTGQSICYNATVNITTAGNGTTFLVENGGHAHLVAGQNVRMLPGTRAFSGSHFTAKITTTGTYCCSSAPPAAPVTVAGSPEPVPAVGSTLFKVYPNPTTGTFVLELTGSSDPGKTEVEIYGILGDRILKRGITGPRQQFDLSGNQPGVYIIRVVTSDGVTGMAKIIRQ
ncbi:MAG TPA: T9SS type A sorting domain-containing protein, partial [Bacteroidales bacterium]|nr:T9SS type A sorting domain-containing protein [Bacteroidales bacterium]